MMVFIRRVHTWSGLIAFTSLLVYGITGLAASFRFTPGRPAIPLVATFERPFQAPPAASDREVAERVCNLLELWLARPVQPAAIQRDSAGRLLLDLWHINGHHRVTVLEAENRIKVEEYRVPVSRYFNVLHMTTASFRSGDWRMNAWAWYNETGLWALAVMMLSGLWLWIAGRAR